MYRLGQAQPFYYRTEASISKTKRIVIAILGLAIVGLAVLGWQLVPSFRSAKTLSPAEKLTQLAKDGLAKNKQTSLIALQSVAITNTMATIDYGTTDLVLEEEAIVTPFMENLGNIVPQVFAGFPNVNALELHQNTRLRDSSRQIYDAVVIRIAITRATSASIDWNNFRPRNLPGLLISKGDSLLVHPAISDGWAAYLQGN